MKGEGRDGWAGEIWTQERWDNELSTKRDGRRKWSVSLCDRPKSQISSLDRLCFFSYTVIILNNYVPLYWEESSNLHRILFSSLWLLHLLVEKPKSKNLKQSSPEGECCCWGQGSGRCSYFKALDDAHTEQECRCESASVNCPFGHFLKLPEDGDTELRQNEENVGPEKGSFVSNFTSTPKIPVYFKTCHEMANMAESDCKKSFFRWSAEPSACTCLTKTHSGQICGLLNGSETLVCGEPWTCWASLCRILTFLKDLKHHCDIKLLPLNWLKLYFSAIYLLTWKH